MSRRQARRDFQDELSYHRRQWQVQRTGWALMALMILLALAGVFGSGPASHVRIGEPPEATISYERFARYATSTRLSIVAPRASPAEPLRLQIDTSFLEGYSIESITPRPHSMRAGSGRHLFEFELDDPQATITLRLRPDRLGSSVGTFRIGATALPVSQFVYP